MNFSLNKLYRNLNISKQSVHEWLDRQFLQQDEWEQLIPLIITIREEHPGMGAKMLYHMIKPMNFGRDRFIELCMNRGFRLNFKPSGMRTTNSFGVVKFPNLIKGLNITRINQVWVSDITYYQIGERFYYITFIMDMKSRFIVGHWVSASLRTIDSTLPALKRALSKCELIYILIFHSDGGGQYYCKEFLNLTKHYKIRNSMTEDVGENNHAERINGTIKNQYLSLYKPTNFKELVIQTERAVRNYNYHRPHQNLNLSTPSFEYGLSAKL